MLTTIREEQLLAKFAGEDVAVPQPCTRTEKFLAKMAGLDVQTPTPITREEQILNKIAEGGGGSSVEVEALSVTENGTYSEEGKAYSPVTVNVEGDAPKATLTLVNNTSNSVTLNMCVAHEANGYDDDVPACCAPGSPFAGANETIHCNTPLYKGASIVLLDYDSGTVTLSGSIEEIFEGAGEYIVTGDATITIEAVA